MASSSSSPEFSNAPPATSQSSVQYSDLSREEVLEDLSSRFILNLPEEELASLERVCFQVEQAHWYYEDFIREQDPSRFPSYTLKTFSEALFRACPLLHHWAHDHERTFQSFMQYKTRVPVCGAIMLNATWDKCVLVKGWKSSAGWGFPKGKINEQEPRPRCAIREVSEETGYDLDGQLDPENVIDLSIKEQSISLYIVPGVPEDYPFQTKTRKEISKIAWFNLSDLPTWKRSKAVPGKFYLITPFIGPLKSYINKRRPRNVARKARQVQNVHVHRNTHPSSEEENGRDGLYPTVHHAHECSSQSSSADNAEPQTPSPQYTAPEVSHAPSESKLSPGTTDVLPAADLDLNGVDPHFARLLNSLSLSASASVADVSDSSANTSLSSRTLSPSASQPNKTAKSTLHHRSSESSDWSIHVPGPARTSSPVMDSVQAGQFTTPSDRSSATVSTTSHPTTPSTTSVINVDRVSSNSTSTPSMIISTTSPRSAAAVPSSMTHSPIGSHARRGSVATADISPYLSRPRDIPKEMRYISMLESVARESDRMSSRMGHHAAFSQSVQMQSMDRSSFAPAPPASVPPSMHEGRMESPVIYSSRPAASTMFTPGVGQITPVYPPSFRDPFTVRPRTSNAFHPSPYPPAPLPAPGVNSRYQMQSNDRRGYPPPPPQPMAAYQRPFHQPPLTGSLQSVPQPYPPVAQPSLRVVPPHQLPASRYGEPPPLSAPAVSPSFSFANRANTSRPANNAHLLSILNSPSAPLRVAPNVVHPGVLHGTGTR
ncbi:Dcp2, box A domain-containing protein [Sparassis latifolia]